MRAPFERSYGTSFDHVRIHEDAAAARLTQYLNTPAVAAGTHVALGRGVPPLDSPRGRHILGHELAHVVQQQRASTESLQSFDPGRGGVAESEAERASRAANAGERFEVRQLADAPLQGYGGVLTDLLGDVVEGSESLVQDLIEWSQRVDEPGIVYKQSGVNLRDEPRPGDASEVTQHLPFNTPVWVNRELPGGWYEVGTGAQGGGFGYVDKNYVKLGPPTPDARIHVVEPGETAIGIAEQYYGGRVKWGWDLRYYINALVKVNAGEGKRGIYYADGLFGEGDDWDDAKTRAGYMIWVPSGAEVDAMREGLSSGSYTYKTYRTVREYAGEDVANFTVGTGAFVAGFIEGVIDWVVDFVVGIKDLLVMLKDVFVSAVRGQLLSDAKALWEELSELDLVEVLSQWWDNLEEKWHQPDLLYRWQYRGRVIGYVVAEILATFLSGGGATAAKWSGKAAKLAKLLASLKLAEKASEIARKLGFEDIGEKIRRMFRKKDDRDSEDSPDTDENGGSSKRQDEGDKTGSRSAHELFDDGVPRDATVSPGEDWEWRGTGEPSSGKGSYYNPKSGESLHPDLEHPDPIGPHWDYKAPSGEKFRIDLDGNMTPKD